MADSQSIRRQIGKLSKQITRQITTVHDTLADYEIKLDNVQLGNIPSDDLPLLRKDCTTARSNLLASYIKLEQLHKNYTIAHLAGQQRTSTFNNFIEKYGDYRTTLATAVPVLEKMDILFNAIDDELTKRHLPLPGPTPSPSDALSLESNTSKPLYQYSDVPTAPPAHAMITTIERDPNSNTIVSPLSNNLCNFVDASLLSKIDLPLFSGSILEFQEFWERFCTLIGNKPHIDDATKFSLLKSSLRGKALHCVQGLPITSANYQIAVDILKTHFDDRVTIRQVLFSKLANLPPCDQTGKDLQVLYNNMYALIRQFCTYEDDSKEYGLGAILLNKLLRHVRSRIYDRTNNQDNLTPSELVHLLTDIVRKESTLREMEFPELNSSERYVFHAHRSHQPTKMRKPHAASITPTFQVKRCKFCSKTNHNSFNCDVYKTPSERILIVRRNRLCYNCLADNHLTKDCRSKKTCSHCSKRHHTSLCLTYSSRSSIPGRIEGGNQSTSERTPFSQVQEQHIRRRSQQPAQSHRSQVHFSEQLPTESTTPNLSELAATLHVSQSTKTVKPPLMCTDVVLFNPTNTDKEVCVPVLLDTGASQSYITNDLATVLQLRTSSPQEITMFTFGNDEPISMQATNHKVGIRFINNATAILHVQALPILTTELKYSSFQETNDAQNQPVRKKIATPQLFIGMDYFCDLVFHDNFSISLLKNGYRVLETRIGKIVTDHSLRFNNSNITIVNYSSTLSSPARHTDLDKLVERFWTHESMGIIDEPNQSINEQCLDDFNSSIRYNPKERRYSVRLPFKYTPSDLPPNRDLAFSRFLSNVKILRKNPDYMERYHAIFTDQLQRGIIEEVNDEAPKENCHYLAHHGVISENKKHTKVRCVFDGSAKKKGSMSINDILHKGPSLLPDLLGILIRIRTMPILISSDIEKAFLMVELHEESRDYTRFFWLRDPFKEIGKSNVVVYRFCRVPFGLICSPFLLAATIHHHLSNTGTPLARKILQNTCVDNVFYGVSSVKEGKKYFRDSKKLFLDAGMNIRDFASSNADINKFIYEEELSKVDSRCKILGIAWDTTTDEFEIRLSQPSAATTWTKRRVLQSVASNYDPFGWITPVVLLGKIFIQKLWAANISWDEPLPQNLANEWTTVLNSWTTTSLTFPRLLTSNAVNIQYDLHIFTDASQLAYAASTYLVEKINGNPKRSSLLVSKSRLSPKKPQMTIPKLELSALTIGTTLLRYVKLHLDIPIQQTFVWSDSKVALAWARSEKDLPIFIRNRVKMIRDNAQNATFLHVPGPLNPADVASRGCTIAELRNNQLWWNGPPFLLKNEDEWPEQLDDTTAEREFGHFTLTNNDPAGNNAQMTPLLNSHRFSKCTRILHTVTNILLFIVRISSKAAYHFGRSTHQLRSKATAILFRLAQEEDPPDKDLYQQLGLYRCNKTNVLRVRTRILNSSLPPETKEPILLPRRSNVTTLFVLYIHETNHHCGTEQTLILLRQLVWIPKGRIVVKHTINNK